MCSVIESMGQFHQAMSSRVPNLVRCEPFSEHTGGITTDDGVVRNILGDNGFGGDHCPVPDPHPGITVTLPPIQTSLPTTVSPRDGRSDTKSECSAQAPPMMGKGYVDTPLIRWFAPFMMNVTPVAKAQNFPITNRSGP